MASQFDLLEFFALLAPAERGVFERAAAVMTVARQDPVITQDTPGGDVYFVIDGRLEVAVSSDRGRNVFYRTLVPGDVFGELAAIDGRPRTATVTTSSNATLVRLSAADFRRILEASHPAAMWLVRRHTAQIRTLTARLFEQVAHDVVTRVRMELIRLAEAAGVKDNRALVAAFDTHQHLAEKLGTTREAVTRELNELQAKGLILKNRRELTVLDYDGLKKLLTV